MKRIIPLLLTLLLLSGCLGERHATPNPDPVLTKYTRQFYDCFDTVIQITAYCETEAEFEAHADAAENEFRRLHRLYDRFHSYEGVTNIKAVNDQAGGDPIAVPREIMDLLSLSIDWHEKSGGKVNIAMGSVTGIWQRYMSMYPRGTPAEDTTIPDRAELEAAGAHIDISSIVLNEQDGTVSITDPDLRIDLGATAKGYATEQVALLLEERGLHSFIISAGGNVRCGSRPEDGERAAWGVGLENPDPDLIQTESGLLDVLYTADMSVVSSGDYQRYYLYGERRIHHLIDPDSLEPGTRYRSVIVVAPDSGMCDALSTAVYLLDMEEGRALAQSVGAEVIWVAPDGEMTVTDALLPSLRDLGGAQNTR